MTAGILWVIGICVSIVWALIFYWVKQLDKVQVELRKLINEQELKINNIESNIWSEDKFRSIINESMTLVVNEIKLLLFEEGILKANKKDN